MNYPDALRKAQTLNTQGHHGQAVQTAAGALEACLVEMFGEVLSQSTPRPRSPARRRYTD